MSVATPPLDPTPPLEAARSAVAAPSARAIALAALVALAIAMGIGRFAFTPLLPMMLHDAAIDLAGAGWLASANYFGYLSGALLCTFQPWLLARLRWPNPGAPALVRGGLLATGALTTAMAVPWPAAWPTLRYAAGVASAVVFVHCSGWCLAQLARRGAPTLGGVMYAGPGLGIAATGLLAGPMVRWHWPAGAAWAFDGLLAFALAACVWRVIRSDATAAVVTPTALAVAANAPAGTASAPAHAGPDATVAEPLEIAALTLAYGLAGFGYIITATFLPVIARATLPPSPWLDLFWPIFGIGVAAGALLASRFHTRLDRRWLLAACYAVQAAGIGLGLVWASPAGFAIGSLLTGLPFTVLTFYAMQEVRRLRPALASSYIGLLTAAYGLGQIVGPLLAAALLRRAADPRAGFGLGLELAIAALLAGSLLYLAMARRWPLPARGAVPRAQ